MIFLEFRRACHGDISVLVEMRILYSIETYGGISEAFENRMRTELPSYFERHLGKDLFAYLALENGEAVSSAMLLVEEKPINPALPDGRTGVVLNVFTKPEHRRKGLARRLMEMLISEAGEAGIDYIELKATESGYPLYKKLGFDEKNHKNIYMTYNFIR